MSIVALAQLSAAVTAARAVCEQIDQGTAKPTWQAALCEGLRAVRGCERISSILRSSATHGFDTEIGRSCDWTALEVKMLCSRLVRAERVEVLVFQQRLLKILPKSLTLRDRRSRIKRQA
mmetsp:Transcript_52689/g.87441  ORF Transcript_52689/g.87441 Transcript_52689/m.87441 type:complete len:120 (+) Transcript_52689:3-362(+)